MVVVVVIDPFPSSSYPHSVIYSFQSNRGDECLVESRAIDGEGRGCHPSIYLFTSCLFFNEMV